MARNVGSRQRKSLRILAGYVSVCVITGLAGPMQLPMIEPRAASLLGCALQALLDQPPEIANIIRTVEFTGLAEHRGRCLLRCLVGLQVLQVRGRLDHGQQTGKTWPDPCHPIRRANSDYTVRRRRATKATVSSFCRAPPNSSIAVA
jgi:hypothetical protein